MGSIFGKVSEETYAYKVITTKASYEIREYAAAKAIQAANDEKAFGKLAKYIGVMSKPQNSAGQSIAMTAPVVTTHPKGSMQFVLPSDLSSPPDPLDPELKVVTKETIKAAVMTWFGQWDEALAEKKKTDLIAAAQSDGYSLNADHWEWHRFNPPWTLPPYKKNELYIPLSS